MLKVTLVLLVLASAGLAQSSSDGSFSVHHSKHANFSISPAQMHEAESLYQSACSVVQHDFPVSGGSHPHFTVILGTDHNEVHGAERKEVSGSDRDDVRAKGEIWMTKWDPVVFAQGVVVLAFLDQVLTADTIKQMGKRAIRYSNATVDVAGLK
jgi:hypothetical protein